MPTPLPSGLSDQIDQLDLNNHATVGYKSTYVLSVLNCYLSHRLHIKDSLKEN